MFNLTDGYTLCIMIALLYMQFVFWRAKYECGIALIT